MLLTLAAAVVVLGVVILVHEVGHFAAAKLAGVGVLRFSIGFGPATPLRFRRGETEYAISWFPLGGYVMMASEEEGGWEGAEPADEQARARAQGAVPGERLFERRPLPVRMLIIAAGVLMNALFAWLLYLGLAAAYGEREDPTTTVAAVDPRGLPAEAQELLHLRYPLTLVRINGDTVRSWNAIQTALLDPTSGRLVIEVAGVGQPVVIPMPGTPGEGRVRLLRALRPAWEPRLGSVVPGRPAAAAGLRTGDLVVWAQGDTVRYWDDLVRVIESHPGEPVVLAVRRGTERLTVRLVPVAEVDSGPGGQAPRTVGKIGVAPRVATRHVRYGVWGAVREATQRTVADAGLVVFALKGLVAGKVSPRELGGPIFIGQLSGQLAQVGLEPFLGFIALFSINLAVLNLLPIPVLDGGRLVFLVAEAIRGRPLSRAVRTRLSQVGVALLLGIMALALTNDLLRLFSG